MHDIQPIHAEAPSYPIHDSGRRFPMAPFRHRRLPSTQRRVPTSRALMVIPPSSEHDVEIARLQATAAIRCNEIQRDIEYEKAFTRRELARIRANTLIGVVRIEADATERQAMIHALGTNLHAKISGDPYRGCYAGTIRQHGWFGKGYSMTIEARV